MGITTTLEKIGDKFAEWHTDTRTGKLHQAIYTEIDNLKNNIDSSNNDNTKNNNQLANWIQKLINNNSATSIDKISNSENLNLKSLSDQIKTIETFLDRNNVKTTTIKNYIDTVVTSHDTGSTYYNNILNNFLIQQDIQASENLNNYQHTGIYRCLGNGISQTLQNKPSGLNTPFILIVLSTFGDSDDKRVDKTYIIRQILLNVYDGDTNQTQSDGFKIYSRFYSQPTNQWSNWSEMYGTHNTAPISMNVEFSSGTKKEYVLLTKL